MNTHGGAMPTNDKTLEPRCAAALKAATTLIEIAEAAVRLAAERYAEAEGPSAMCERAEDLAKLLREAAAVVDKEAFLIERFKHLGVSIAPVATVTS